ncbi:hypothetical protein C1646_819781 [Rhizophagus diaphanus]|nr:hypothetical protein C1646_819781 [Rhizophagus diaphanus] [Rhizophagus sp. MUCL 43196]
MAFQDLSGTSVAYIEPNRDQFSVQIANENDTLGNKKQNEKKTKTIPGISKWFEWNWPVMVVSFCGASYRLSLIISELTIPKSSWVMPISEQKAGNLRPADRYLPEAIHTSLQNLVIEGELISEEIPMIKTIKGWIGSSESNTKRANKCQKIS